MAGLDADPRLDFGLAVREAAVNAMKHAHHFDPQIPLELRFDNGPGEIRVSVLDRGPGFNPDDTPDCCAPENLLRDSGRGLFLIRSLVDEVEFIQHGEGMELILHKRFKAAPATT